MDLIPALFIRPIKQRKFFLNIATFRFSCKSCLIFLWEKYAALHTFAYDNSQFQLLLFPGDFMYKSKQCESESLGL